MITFLSVLVVFSVLILVHETGHFLMAKRMGVRIERFSFGFGPKLLSFRKGETEYLICAIPLGGYVKMAGDEPTEKRQGKEWEYLSKPPIKRFGIVISGPLTNYLLAFSLFSLMFVLGVPAFTTEVGEVLEGHPAYSAGIKKGDEIISFDGKQLRHWDDLLLEVTNATSGREANLVVLREGAAINVKLVPRVIETKNIFGQHIKIGRLGIASAGKTTILKTGILHALYLGGERVITLTALTYKALWHIITGGMPARESLAGPVRIAAEIGKAARMGIIYLIHITAQINLAIAIFNLLPFPVLDGGHILFLGLEKIRGRQLSPKAEQVITQIAITLLITLAVFISWNDILNLIK